MLTASGGRASEARHGSGLPDQLRRQLTAAALGTLRSLGQLRSQLYSYRHKPTTQTADAILMADRLYRARRAALGDVVRCSAKELRLRGRTRMRALAELRDFVAEGLSHGGGEFDPLLRDIVLAEVSCAHVLEYHGLPSP